VRERTVNDELLFLLAKYLASTYLQSINMNRITLCTGVGVGVGERVEKY
jgi:hypothetical protein